MDFILGLMLTPIFVGALFLFAVIADHTEHEGWASFILLSSFAILYHIFKIDLVTIAYGAGAWIVAGVVYSFVRWMYQCNRAAGMYEAKSIDKYRALEMTDIARNKGTITYWAFAWPISLVSTVLTDCLSWMGKWLHFAFGNAFRWASDKSRMRINDIANDRND